MTFSKGTLSMWATMIILEHKYIK